MKWHRYHLSGKTLSWCSFDYTTPWLPDRKTRAAGFRSLDKELELCRIVNYSSEEDPFRKLRRVGRAVRALDTELHRGRAFLHLFCIQLAVDYLGLSEETTLGGWPFWLLHKKKEEGQKLTTVCQSQNVAIQQAPFLLKPLDGARIDHNASSGQHKVIERKKANPRGIGNLTVSTYHMALKLSGHFQLLRYRRYRCPTSNPCHHRYPPDAHSLLVACRYLTPAAAVQGAGKHTYFLQGLPGALHLFHKRNFDPESESSTAATLTELKNVVLGHMEWEPAGVQGSKELEGALVTFDDFANGFKSMMDDISPTVLETFCPTRYREPLLALAAAPRMYDKLARDLDLLEANYSRVYFDEGDRVQRDAIVKLTALCSLDFPLVVNPPPLLSPPLLSPPLLSATATPTTATQVAAHFTGTEVEKASEVEKMATLKERAKALLKAAEAVMTNLGYSLHRQIMQNLPEYVR